MPLLLLVCFSVLPWGTAPVFERMALRGGSPPVVLRAGAAFNVAPRLTRLSGLTGGAPVLGEPPRAARGPGAAPLGAMVGAQA